MDKNLALDQSKIVFPPRQNLHCCIFYSCRFLPSSSLWLYSSACPPSQASSCSPSPALSTESLSSCSDHGSSPLPLGGSATSVQEQSFTKSVSEPSIASSDDTSVPSSSPADSRHTANARPHSTAVTANASSAPNTPQTNRSSDGLRPKAPPPRPSTTPSPLVAQSPKKVQTQFYRKRAVL